MSREILFRAKCCGVWRYGSYVHFDKKPINDCFNNEYKDFIVTNGKYGEHCFPITELSSIGQYTGLKDKNGKEIYEGDIIDFTVYTWFDYRKKYKGVVKYSDLGFVVDTLDDKFELGWISYNKTLKIVGNIHDNPELMKGGSNEEANV